MKAALQKRVEFKSLELYLRDNQLKPQKRKKLLAKIPSLDKDVIMKLETVGVYDSEEFLIVKDELESFLGLTTNEFKQLTNNIHQASVTEFSPKINLELPNEIAFVATHEQDEHRALALIYEDFLFYFSNPRSEGWNLVKYAFERLVQQLEEPLLLSCTMDENLPSWLDVDEITTYFGGLNPMKSVYQQVDENGFQSIGDSIYHNTIHKVLKLKLLHVLGSN